MNSLRVPFNYRLFTKENYMGRNDEKTMVSNSG